MASQVNKGFLTYFMLFVGIVFGAILVCASIMIIMPGTVIFGFTYENYNSKVTIKNLNGVDEGYLQTEYVNLEGETIPREAPTIPGEGTPNPNFKYFEIANISKIVIITNHVKFATVQNSDNNRIEIINSAKGFSKQDEITPFRVTKCYDVATKTLKITISDTNPKLSFSNNRAVYLFLNSTDLGEVAFEITTESGSVDFGSTTFSTRSINNIEVDSVDFSTTTGNFFLSKNTNIQTTLNVVAEKSTVTLQKDLDLLNSASFKITDGRIYTQNLKAPIINFKGQTCFINSKNLNMKTTVSSVVDTPPLGTPAGTSTVTTTDTTSIPGTTIITTVVTQVVVLGLLAERTTTTTVTTMTPGEVNYEVKNGDFNVDNIIGNLTDSVTPGSVDVKNVVFRIKNITGNFSIPATEAGAIEIDEISGEIAVVGKSTNITIKKANGAVDIATETGDVKLLVTDTNANQIQVETTKGDIIALFENEWTSTNNTLTTTEGEIRLFYKTGVNFTTESNTSGQIDFVDDDKHYSDSAVAIIGYPVPLNPGDPVPSYPNKITMTSEFGNIRIDRDANVTWALAG